MLHSVRSIIVSRSEIVTDIAVRVRFEERELTARRSFDGNVGIYVSRRRRTACPQRVRARKSSRRNSDYDAVRRTVRTSRNVTRARRAYRIISCARAFVDPDRDLRHRSAVRSRYRAVSRAVCRNVCGVYEADVCDNARLRVFTDRASDFGRSVCRKVAYKSDRNVFYPTVIDTDKSADRSRAERARRHKLKADVLYHAAVDRDQQARRSAVRGLSAASRKRYRISSAVERARKYRVGHL